MSEAEAENIAMRLLARREHSFDELAHKLGLRGVAEEIAVATVERLSRQGLQSDRRYAGAILRTRVEAGYGALRIRAELRRRGVAAAIVEAALEQHEIDWVVLARRRICRRYSSDVLNSPREKSRVVRYLLARGFCHEHIDEALNTAWVGADPQ